MKYIKVLVILSAFILSSLNPVFAQAVSTIKVKNVVVNPCKIAKVEISETPEEKVSETLKENTSFTGVPEGFRVSKNPTSWISSGSIVSSSNRVSTDANQPPIIEKIILSKNEVIYGRTDEKSRFIDVEVKATDPENDVLTYNFTVSTGRIIGQGAKVKWDLCGAEPGTYTITATIDDGCGVCAEPKTETVDVIANTKNKSKTQVPQ